ncbi:hypothetical protein J2T26_004743 [Citrobacter farmeri]|nr:hypothetical protein [Citrobacter farmeri]MCW2424963.1 hypothetical protein [Citrobacter farmeri]
MVLGDLKAFGWGSKPETQKIPSPKLVIDRFA